MTWLCGRCGSPTTSSRCARSWRRSACARGWSRPAVAGWRWSPEAGMVALHSARDSESQAPSGFTSLSFDADDVDALAKRLRDARRPRRRRVRRGVRPGAGLCRPARRPPADRRAQRRPLRLSRCTNRYGVAPGLRVMPLRLADPARRVRRLPGAARLRAARCRSPSTSPPSRSGRAATGSSAYTHRWIRRVSARARACWTEPAPPTSPSRPRRTWAGSRSGWSGPGSRRPWHTGPTSVDVLSVSDADGLRLEVHVTPSAP